MRLRCRIGRHVWGLWKKPVHDVPMYKFWAPHSSGRTYFVVGHEYTPCEAPAYRKCLHCPAMEVKDER